MLIARIIECSLYFLALINPISKILVIVGRKPAYTQRELIPISIRSTIISLGILITLTAVGDFVMTKIFHVEIYSLSVAGGIILFLIGSTAVRKGSFIEKELPKIEKIKAININATQQQDISIVPLAAPLIAGPGTITAAISFASLNGTIITIIGITIAVLLNMFCMMLSFPISRTLEKIKATEPIIRITGLIVTAVAMQMIFSGCTTWIIKSF